MLQAMTFHADMGDRVVAHQHGTHAWIKAVASEGNVEVTLFLDDRTRRSVVAVLANNDDENGGSDQCNIGLTKTNNG